MGRVYANALCNVAAAASDRPESGLFRARDPNGLLPGFIHASVNTGEAPKAYFVIDEDYANRQLFRSALLQRGWVFQERLLCPRVLYFTEEQVFWECFAEQSCEALPHGIPGSVSSKRRDMPVISNSKQDHDAKRQQGSGLISPQAFRTWRMLVEKYSHCKLTKTSDKLFALAGIAGTFRNYLGDEYVAGLWKYDLVMQLSYSVLNAELPHPAGYCAPSWSWASLNERIQYSGTLDKATAHVSVLDVQSSQRLTIRGHLTRATLEPNTQHLDGNIVLNINDQLIEACTLPDTVDIKTQEVRELTILTLISYPTEVRGAKNPLEVEGLVLEPVLTTVMETYRRIGHLNSFGVDWSSHSE